MENQSRVNLENKECVSEQTSPVTAISPQTVFRRSLSTISTDSLANHPLQNIDEEEIESLSSSQRSRRSPSSSSTSSMSSLQPKISPSHLVAGDSLGGLILAKLREMNDEFSDIVRLLIAKRATLLLPASVITPSENVDRLLLQDHVIVTQPTDEDIKVLSLNGLMGFIQKDTFKAIGLISSEKDIMASITESQRNRKSIFETFSKPADFSHKSLPIKILCKNADMLLHGMTIQTIVIESPVIAKEIAERIVIKTENGKDVEGAELSESLLKEIHSFIENFQKKPPQDEDSSNKEIQRLYENVRHHFESQLKVSEELAEASEDEIDESMNVVEKLLCTSLYEHLFCPKWSDDDLQDENLGSQIAALNILELNLSKLGVNIDPHHQERVNLAVQVAGVELQSLEQKKAPFEKLDSIIRCHKVIVEALEKRSLSVVKPNVNTDNEEKSNSSNLNTHVKSKSTVTSPTSPASIPLPDSPTTPNGTSVSTPSEEKHDPNADVILPLLIFIAVKSNPKKLLAVITFLENVDYEALGLSPNKVLSEPMSAGGTKVTLERNVSRVGQEIVGVADSGIKAITGVMDTSYKMIGRVFGYNESANTSNPSTFAAEKTKENLTAHQDHHLTKTKINDIVMNSEIPTEIIVRELAEFNSGKFNTENGTDGDITNKNMQIDESKSL
ncbi:16153_t:CDS:2 [Acaulospora colombiana]|uniref:16153_t:CDS:1 n=1 Tax=Acaulospora colombiana TaxID=27376 RepID=A0ACA9LH85_9GLOM|nr:16153_t:CDS:2 [Acaulospora colombiana]